MQRKTVLSVASGGGHWVQLLKIGAQLGDFNNVYVATSASFVQDVEGREFFIVSNFDRGRPFSALKTIYQVHKIVWAVRPDVIISTGAAPGFVAIVIGKLSGAATVWVDSLANVDALSLSGRLARRWSDLWLTQWQHLARADGPYFSGSLL